MFTTADPRVMTGMKSMSTRPDLLLVDPDLTVREQLGDTLTRRGFRVTLANDLTSSLKLLESSDFDALVVELRLRDGSGLDLVRAAARRPTAPAMVVTAERPETRDVVDAVQCGALDVVEKPVFPERLIGILMPALARRSKDEGQDVESEPVSQLSRPPIVGTSPALRRVMDQVARVATTPQTTVLIQGESGTGKELVARAIHYDGTRSERPFMAINCAALNESILEAELFGYESGAFTGANRQGKKGLFEAADGGTVFLDEIGEMTGSLQAKLLRVLQESSFKRVGGVNDVHVDIRIIAATNRDLWEEVAAGRFRKDLYYRLNVMPIRVPALRERREDVLELAQHFLDRFSEAMRKPIRGLSEEARRILMHHGWPGNVRELRNVCEYAVIVCDGTLIEPRHLAVTETEAVQAEQASTDGAIYLPLKDWSLRTMEEQLIRMVLNETRFNITRAAQKLGINRSTLYNKMRDYGLSRDGTTPVRQSV